MAITPDWFLNFAVRPALQILPGRMDSPRAEAMILAIGIQESELKYRRQMGDGPARSFLQFEPIGVRGVMEHHATRDYARGLCIMLCVGLESVYEAIEYNDVLAAGFARLALWRIPEPLPDGRMDEDLAWRQYIKAWRPGRPRRERWHDSYSAGWAAV